MFKKTRRKIVAVIMSILVCLLLGTLVIIYASSYFELRRTNFAMLSRYAQMYILPGQAPEAPGKNDTPDKKEPFFDKLHKDRPFEQSYLVSTFYSVAISRDGAVLATDTGNRENERMGVLVSELLTLARAEDARPKHEPLDFSRLVAGGVLPFESLAFEHGLTLKTELADNVCLCGLAPELSRLVSILVDNAIRHSSGSSEILIRLEKKRSHAILSVINGSAAIPPDQLPHLFDRFYRTDETRNSQSEHYGLGLAIAKAIVDAHHGKIDVHCHDGLIEFQCRLPRA